MKKKLLLLMALCLLAGTKALGTDATINGIHYDFMGDEAMVTFNNWSGVDYSGSVVIPNSVTYNDKTYSVTTINSYAFNHCSNLVSITIPSTLKRVKTEAFCI